MKFSQFFEKSKSSQKSKFWQKIKMFGQNQNFQKYFW